MRCSGIVIGSLTVLFAGLAYFIFFLAFPDKKAADLYEKLIANEHANNATPSYEARQQRQSLQKDFLFLQNNDRLQIRLTSEHADLVFDHQNGQMEIVEQMSNVRCFIQEKLFYQLSDGQKAFRQSDGRLLIENADSQNSSSWLSPDTAGIEPMQIACILKADKASYYYKNNLFVAENVNLIRYILPGHHIAEIGEHQKELMRVESGYAEYNGKQINLKDHVVVDHELGRISANQVTLLPTSETGKMNFGILQIRDQIKIALSEGGELYCSCADVDYQQSKGKFYGNSMQDKIVYKENDITHLGKVDFSAGVLFWDQANQTLTLKENVEINQIGFAKLNTDNEVHLTREVVEGHTKISVIESLADTTVVYYSKEENLEHTLKCHGKLVVDHKNLKVTLDSPRDGIGEITKDKQVSFCDSKGEVYADRLELTYGYQDHHVSPEKITLKDNVRVRSHLTPTNEETTSVLQYAVGDYMEYAPQTNEMLFKAKENRRVLFYDKVNNLQVSAPALKLQRDKTTGKFSVQGIGDVRFSFVEQEFQQLRKRFSFERGSL